MGVASGRGLETSQTNIKYIGVKVASARVRRRCIFKDLGWGGPNIFGGFVTMALLCRVGYQIESIDKRK